MPVVDTEQVSACEPGGALGLRCSLQVHACGFHLTLATPEAYGCTGDTPFLSHLQLQKTGLPQDGSGQTRVVAARQRAGQNGSAKLHPGPGRWGPRVHPQVNS